ncbi:unnamed protein product, partial [Ectocarpus fasciculatus]
LRRSRRDSKGRLHLFPRTLFAATMSQGTVKACLSGDTVLLIGRAGTHGPPPEMQLSLASLSAPKLGRAPGIADEQFAWDSREFLRKKCIGKQVTFKVEFQAGASGRNFGWVKLDGESLAVAVAAAGWARVKDQGTSSKSSELEELVELGKTAEANKLGIFTDDSAKQEAGSREVKWTDVDGVAILAAHKGVPVKATIEHLRDGSSYRALLHDSWTMISFSLAGVACPRMNAPARRPPPAANAAAAAASAAAGKTAGMSAASIVAGGGGGGGGVGASNGHAGAANGSNGAASPPPPPPQPEPHAAEAKFFSEVRLLHREVDLLLQGVDKQGNLYGAVLHPKGDVRHELLKQGLARMVDWSLVYVSRSDALAMRQAENEGKRARLRLWQEWAPPQIDGDADYAGVVVEASGGGVHSGDQISVTVPGGPVGQERRLALSSIRAPRMGNPRRGVEDEPWAVESKEALRKLAIGKQVKVVVDYQRDIPQTTSGEAPVKRAFATVSVGSNAKSLQEVMVETGMAGVARLRQDDPRTEHYDAIVAAEANAKAGKKGVHSGAAPRAHRLTDLCGDSKKAKTYVNFLVRQGNVKAIVEHVFGGSRFKVFVPKENCAFMFAMTEVRCPQPPRAGDNRGGGRPGDPFGREALAFSREKLMQRNVELRVTDMDKNGVALGFLSYGTGSQRRNFAADILEAGFGKLDAHALERTGGGAQSLLNAQAAGKAAKAGVWSIEPTEAEMKDKEFVVSEEMNKYRLCEIADGGHFFVHDAEGGDLALIEAKLKELKDKVGTSGATMEPRRGTLCAALFDDGNGPAWYRAKVLGSTPVGMRVLYVDHGNTATVKSSSLRPLDSSYFAFRPQAR